MEVVWRIAATYVLTLCVGSSWHVIALKSQLLSRLGGSPSPSDTPLSYDTFYFEQKVSLKGTFYLFIFLKYLFSISIYHIYFGYFLFFKTFISLFNV